jgi:hypothetical protein
VSVTAAPRPRVVHYTWIVASVTFATLLVGAAIRALSERLRAPALPVGAEG